MAGHAACHVAADGGGEGMIPTTVAGAPADELRSRGRALAVLVAVVALPLWAATLLLLVSKAATLGFVSPLGLIFIGLSVVLGGLVRQLWRFASGRVEPPQAPVNWSCCCCSVCHW